VFGLSDEQYEVLLESHGSFYCPNGHPQHFTGESDAEKFRKLSARLQARCDQQDAEIQDTVRRLRSTRGVVTRIKNRVGKGVCPCCNRYFANLHRHMESKHPAYTSEARA
jgi:hypothetical protein